MENVVVAVDGTPTGEAALDWVIDRARRADLAVEIVVVQEPVGSEDGSDVISALDFSSIYEGVMDAAAVRVREEAPNTSVRTVLRIGRARIELTQAASHADLVVIGGQHRGAVSGTLAGTLPLRVAATAPCPTVVVPTGWRAATAGDDDPGPVTVGVDVTKQHPVVVRYAENEARRAGAPLEVVAAWHVPTLVAVAMLAQTGVWSNLERSREAALRTLIASIREGAPDLVVRPMLREGPAPRILTEEASTSRLLVIGRHSARSAADVLLGATAHALLLELACPTMVVPDGPVFRV
jgi:nucleotide-binding universal stress UspA family protein